MVDPDYRESYLATLRQSLRPGGYVILATFGPAGPTQCGGLAVRRYGASEIGQVLGAEFEPIASQPHVHTTPSGNEQQVQYALFRRRSLWAASTAAPAQNHRPAARSKRQCLTTSAIF